MTPSTRQHIADTTTNVIHIFVLLFLLVLGFSEPE